MKSIAALLLGAVAYGAPIAPPRFPVSWTANEVDELNIAQGATTNPDGSVCCAPKSTCKVQTEYQAGINYYDGVNNQTRFDGGGQIIVTQYGIGKQMLVDGNLVCQEYCPTQGDFDPSPFWPTAAEKENIKDLGKTTIDGVAVQHYQWIEHIFKVVKVQQTDMYIANVTGAAVPVHETDLLEPFGQQIGTSDIAWTQFTPGQPDAKLFAVTGIANCPESQGCNQNMYQRARLRSRDFAAYIKYAQDRN